jgi:hypothetical protein
MLQRAKLDMEDYFNSTIPEGSRSGCRFVFRQGNPLDAEALEMVAAGKSFKALFVQKVYIVMCMCCEVCGTPRRTLNL